LSALLLLDAIDGFNFKYKQYIRFSTIMYRKERNRGDCFSNALNMCLNEQNTQDKSCTKKKISKETLHT